MKSDKIYHDLLCLAYSLPVGMHRDFLHVEDLLLLVVHFQVVLADDDSEEVGALVAGKVMRITGILKVAMVAGSCEN